MLYYNTFTYKNKHYYNISGSFKSQDLHFSSLIYAPERVRIEIFVGLYPNWINRSHTHCVGPFIETQFT